MKNNLQSVLARSLVLATLSSIPLLASADDSFLKDLSLSGQLDLYYQYDFNRPATGGAVEVGRQFDISHNTGSLAIFQLNISKKITEASPVGFTVNLGTGKNTSIIDPAAGPDKGNYKNILQAYVSYNLAKTGYTVDFGKFYSWIGYEGVSSADNDNYSRSFLYTLAQPIYHAGVRVSGPVTSALTGSLFLVNGWNEVEDSNASKTLGASLTYALGTKTSITANWLGGNEGSANANGFGTGAVTNVQLGDLVVTHQLSDTVKLALNADYGSAKASDTGGPSGKFRGIAGYINAKLSKDATAGLRYETVSDPDGIRGTNNARLSSLTGTYSYSVSANALWRLEARYDKSNRSMFADKNGMKDSRTTLTLSHVLKF